jgi:hypothetical protein
MNYFDYIRKYLDKEISLECIPVCNKAPFIEQWQAIKVTDEVIDHWEENFTGKANGFGFRAGQYNIGYMDIDTDDIEMIYRIDEIMDLSQICVKKGLKGKTVFFRFEGSPKKSKYNVYLRQGDKKPVVEINFTSGQTVLPPSIHPDTGTPYKWISMPLLEVDIEDLPLINEDKIQYLETILRAASLQEGLKEVPTGVTGEGSGKWKTITSECARLLHLGADESSIARTLVGMDRQLFPNNQFFFSEKIGKDLVSKENDIENATLWVTTFKQSLMRQDPELRKTLSSIVRAAEVSPLFGEWETPKPLMPKALALEYPEHLFPESCKEYCHHLAKLSNMPPEAFLAGIMTTFSAISQGKVIIQPKSDFIVHPSISLLIIAPSGSRKDTIFDGAKAPMMKLINRDKDKIDSNFIENEKDLCAKIEDLTKKKKKALSEGDEELVKEFNKQIIELQNELITTKKMRPNFIFESGTQERLYQLMKENEDRGIFLCSSEYVQLMGNLGKKGNEALRGFYLKLLNGSVNETFNHETISGVKVDLRRVFGCSMIGVQTDVFAQEIKNLEAGRMNDGLLQRYFVLNVNPKVKRMQIIKDPVDSRKIDNMFALLYDLKETVFVDFLDEALEAYLDYDFHLNEKSQFDKSAIKSFRSKYSGQSVKLAWIYAQLDAKPGTIIRTITKEHYLKAVEWLEWQSRSLDITWANNSYNNALRAAQLILETVRMGGIRADHFQNDILKFSKMSAGDFNDGMQLLIESNYLRTIKNRVEINPLL